MQIIKLPMWLILWLQPFIECYFICLLNGIFSRVILTWENSYTSKNILDRDSDTISPENLVLANQNHCFESPGGGVSNTRPITIGYTWHLKQSFWLSNSPVGIVSEFRTRSTQNQSNESFILTFKLYTKTFDLLGYGQPNFNEFMTSLIIGTFLSAHCKFNFASSNADSMFILFSWANFSIWSISVWVVESETICNRIDRTSFLFSNLKFPINIKSFNCHANGDFQWVCIIHT